MSHGRRVRELQGQDNGLKQASLDFFVEGGRHRHVVERPVSCIAR